MNVYYGDSGELMATIPLKMYEELLEIKGRYLELKEQKANTFSWGNTREPLDLNKYFGNNNTVTVDGRGLTYDNNGNRPEFK